jgi:hypothetical protein
MQAPIQLNPQFIAKNGVKEFAVIPYEEFVKLQEMLEDLEDLVDFAEAKAAEGESESIPWSEVKSTLGL